jgi:hypothetical protein
MQTKLAVAVSRLVCNIVICPLSFVISYKVELLAWAGSPRHLPQRGNPLQGSGWTCANWRLSAGLQHSDFALCCLYLANDQGLITND